MSTYDKEFIHWKAKNVIKKTHLKPGVSKKKIKDEIHHYAFSFSDGPGDYYATMDMSDELYPEIKKILKKKAEKKAKKKAKKAKKEAKKAKKNK